MEIVYETICKQVHKEQINYINRLFSISLDSDIKILSLGASDLRVTNVSHYCKSLDTLPSFWDP